MASLDLSHLPILIVDDDPFIRELIADMLRGMGYRAIKEARDGTQAKDLLLAANPPFKVILLDLEMPTMGGFEVLKYIRNAKEVPNRQVPVIVLTGHSRRDIIVKAAQLGIHGFLIKPVAAERIDREIKKALVSPMIDPARLAD